MTAVRVSSRAIVALILMAATRASAQSGTATIQLAQRAPTFYMLTGDHSVAVDVHSISVLQQRIAVDFDSVTLPDAIDAIRKAAHVDISYNTADVPASQRVSLTASKITLGAALTAVLLDVSLDVRISRHGALILAPRSENAGKPDYRQADSTVFRGTVTDASTHVPLSGAVVRIERVDRKASTGGDGAFSITLSGRQPGAYRLVARRLGYAPLTATVVVDTAGVYICSFALTASATRLDQVVTTATGEQGRRAVGNDLPILGVDSLVPQTSTGSFSDVLSGRVAGVQVFLPGGLIGAAPEINIRGQNSASLQNQPLLYVDGVRVDNSSSDGTSSGRFNDIVPEEIASIEIVRGPAAATLYGTDAANGVILIRTKRGGGNRPRWSFYGEQGILTIDKSRFGENYYPWGHSSSGIQQCTLSAVAAQACVQDSVTQFTPLRNPALTPLGQGSIGHYGAQLSGGSSTRYFLSGSYDDQAGYLKLPTLERDSLLIQRGGAGLPAGSGNPNGLTKAAFRSNGATSIGTTADVSLSSAFLTQNTRLPQGPVLAFGEYGPGYRAMNDGWTFARPEDYFLPRHNEDADHLTAGATANWRPVGWLSLKATTGVDYSAEFVDQLIENGEGNPFQTAGSRINARSISALYSVDVGATASFDVLPRMTSRTSIGAQYNRQTLSSTIADGANLPPGCNNVQCASQQTSGESSTGTIVAGMYAEQTFGLNGRLFATGAVRVDGSNTFGSSYRSAVYPRGSLSWVVSEEPFWPHIPAISNLRLRTAYGQAAVEPRLTDVLATEGFRPVFVDGQPTTGAGLSSLGNSQLRPERQREIEGGADVGLFHDRVQIEATYYDKRSSDALVQVPVGPSAGGGFQTANIGSVWNWGYEANVAITLLKGSAVSASVNGNASVNHNQLLTLGPGVIANYGANGLPGIAPGYPLFSYFGTRIVSYRDLNHDGILEPNELTLGDSNAFRGPSYPATQISGGASIGLFHDKLRLHTQFDYRGGVRLTNIPEAFKCLLGYCLGVSERSAPLSSQAAALAYTTAGDWWGYYEDGSFLRWRELSATLELPQTAARAMHASEVSITLAARNLAIWTRYTGADPEVGMENIGNQQYGAYNDDGGQPPPTYWTVRLNLTF